jgi:hypothetical protein
MSGRFQVFIASAAAFLSVSFFAASAHAEIDWVCLGLAKPKPTGPMNNCYGYFHTSWHAWKSECQPPPAQIPIVIAEPAKTEPAPAPAATPPATPPANPPVNDKDKSGSTSGRASVTRVSATQPALPKATVVTPKSAPSADSGWSPVPAIPLPKK